MEKDIQEKIDALNKGLIQINIGRYCFICEDKIVELIKVRDTWKLDCIL